MKDGPDVGAGGEPKPWCQTRVPPRDEEEPEEASKAAVALGAVIYADVVAKLRRDMRRPKRRRRDTMDGYEPDPVQIKTR